MFACYHITGIASPWLILSRETWFIYVAAAKARTRVRSPKKLTMTLLKLISSTSADTTLPPSYNNYKCKFCQGNVPASRQRGRGVPYSLLRCETHSGSHRGRGFGCKHSEQTHSKESSWPAKPPRLCTNGCHLLKLWPDDQRRQLGC